MKKLPIPTLEETQEKYLRFIKAVLSEEDFNKSKKLSNEFFNNSAITLQKLLEEEKETTTTSWLHKYWLDMYLKTTNSVNIDANFCMDLKLQNQLLKKNHKELLNTFCLSLAKVCKDFSSGNFEEVVDGRGNKLCINQFQILKGASRVSSSKKDYFNISTLLSNYITIFYKNNLYKIEVFNEKAYFNIEEALSNILENTTKSDSLLASFSFLATKVAGEIRDELYMKNQYFDIIENSLFNISIIDEEFNSEEEKRYHMLYLNGENSWILKPLNFIYNLNDKSFFVNADHSYEDAGTVIEIVKRCFNNTQDEIKTEENSKATLIKEYIDENNKKKIKYHLEEYKKQSEQFYCKDLHLNFSNEECRKYSKDTLMQMIMLYAHYKTYDKFYGVYEAVDMREYTFGRTECVRVLSTQGIDFVKALDIDENKEKLTTLLNEANIEHKNRIKDAKKAKGIDRHLYGLKAMMRKSPKNIQDEASKFFNDLAYKNVTQNFISTTCTGTSDIVGYLLFTPVEFEGLGVTYLKTQTEIIYLISYHLNKKEKANNFAKYLALGAEKLRKLLS